MEELTARIQNAKVADYVKEALACYGAGAYRACIVLMFIAVFEDLRQKTRTLSGVNKSAKDISKQIEELASGQKPFESQLIDKLLAAGLIEVVQAQRLKQIVDHRNKAAHPSGVHASAEEARFVYFESIDKLLSEPVLSANHAVDEIIESLQNKNYFPSNSIANIKSIVGEEASAIHDSARRYLVIRVTDLLKSTESHVSKNARFFVIGLASIGDGALQTHLIDVIVKAKCVDPKYGNEIAFLVSVDPTILSKIDEVTAKRVAALLKEVASREPGAVGETVLRHPLQLAKNITGALEDATLFPIYSGFFDELVQRYWTDPSLLRSVTKSPKARKLLIEKYAKSSQSLDFKLANSISTLLPQIDSALSSVVNGDEAFKLLSGIRRAAASGAWSAQVLCEADFQGVPKLLAKAALYAESALGAGSVSSGLDPSHETYFASRVGSVVAGEVDDEEVPF